MDKYTEFVKKFSPSLYRRLKAAGVKNVDAAHDYMLRQLAFESGWGESPVAKTYNNYAGWGHKVVDGKHTYSKFKDSEDFLDTWVPGMLGRYRSAIDAPTLNDYAINLKNKGYYEDSLDHYMQTLNGMGRATRAATVLRQSNPELYEDAAELMLEPTFDLARYNLPYIQPAVNTKVAKPVSQQVLLDTPNVKEKRKLFANSLPSPEIIMNMLAQGDDVDYMLLLYPKMNIPHYAGGKDGWTPDQGWTVTRRGGKTYVGLGQPEEPTSKRPYFVSSRTGLLNYGDLEKMYTAATAGMLPNVLTAARNFTEGDLLKGFVNLGWTHDIQQAPDGTTYAVVAPGILDAGDNAVEKFTTLYRKINSGQLLKILDGGEIRPLKSEKNGLTLTSSKPRKAPYYIKITNEDGLPVKTVMEGGYYNTSPFARRQDNLSKRMLMSDDFKPFITDSNVELYAKVDGKYKRISDPYSNPDLQIQKTNPKLKSEQIVESLRGTERKLDDHTILTTPLRRSNFTSDDYIVDPYSTVNFFNWDGNRINPYKELERLRADGRSTGNKSYGNRWERSYNDRYFYSTKDALDYRGLNDVYNDAVRLYIDGYAGNVHNMFEGDVLQHAMLDHYKNFYGIDLTNLTREERAAFMLKLYDNSGQELLFHSTNYPFVEWDPSKLTYNTGNEGFYGRGLYVTDVPTEDYGLLQQPLLISKPKKQIIITEQPGQLRLSSPQQDVDDALAMATKGSWKVDKSGKWKRPDMYSPYVGMDVGGRPDFWNKWLKDNHIDLVRATKSSKGSGVFPEILIPENTSVKVSHLFPKLTVTKP